MTTEARAAPRPSSAPSPTGAHPRAALAQRASQQDQPAHEGITVRGPGRAGPGRTGAPAGTRAHVAGDGTDL